MVWLSQTGRAGQRTADRRRRRSRQGFSLIEAGLSWGSKTEPSKRVDNDEANHLRQTGDGTWSTWEIWECTGPEPGFYAAVIGWCADDTGSHAQRTRGLTHQREHGEHGPTRLMFRPLETSTRICTHCCEFKIFLPESNVLINQTTHGRQNFKQQSLVLKTRALLSSYCFILL